MKVHPNKINSTSLDFCYGILVTKTGEKMTKNKTELREKQYINSWTTMFSIVMFFIAFFSAYFAVGHDLSVAFVKSMFVLIVTHIVSKIIIMIWRFAIPKEQWALIVHGPPHVDSRSEKRNAAILAAIEAEKAEALRQAEALKEAEEDEIRTNGVPPLHDTNGVSPLNGTIHE